MDCRPPFLDPTVGGVDAKQFLSLIDQRLTEARLANPAFSLRAFSKRLGVSPSTISELRTGKRKLTADIAARLADRLCLAPRDRGALLEDLESAPIGDRALIEHDVFEMIGGWAHTAILSLIKVKDFEPSPLWIAKRLGISRKEAAQSLGRLERLGLVEWEANGKKLARTKQSLATRDGVPNVAVRKAHAEGLELARRALDEVPVHERDFIFHVLASSPGKLPEAGRRVRKFLNELAAFLEEGESEEVYRVAFQIFPVSQSKLKEG